MSLVLVTPRKGDDLPELRGYNCRECLEAMTVEINPPEG
jgi:hypothetical protein